MKERSNAIKIHLSLTAHRMQNGLIAESCLTAALREARLMTARSKMNGEPDTSNKFGYLGHWLGAMGYMIILDQIGKCYRPKGKSRITNKKSNIIKSLIYYTSLSEDEIIALYALRNAFFHDFGLFNKDNTKNFHHFLVDNHPTNPVVVLPKEKWDGDLNNLKRKNTTYVNLKTLGDLVESIYTKLIEYEGKNELFIELKGGASELLTRYVFYHL
jgi:hypothetical protein